mgnify:CR=1 FL=1
MSNQSALMQPASFNNSDASKYLGVSPSSLEKSRETGLLLGVKSLRYRRAGKRVIYLKTDCDIWLEELPSFTNTAEEYNQSILNKAAAND